MSALRRRYRRCPTQTSFGKRGNCLSAAVACVLGLPLRDVPFFGGDQIRQLDAWVRRYGLRARYVASRRPPRGLHVLLGGSPRMTSAEGGHAVVSEGGRIVHDPHPSGRGLRGVDGYVEFTPAGAP